MKRYDLVVLGAGSVARLVATRVAGAGKRVAIVSLNDDAASFFERAVQALTDGAPPAEPESHGPEGVDTFRGAPRFVGSRRDITIGDVRLSANNVLIATGALPRPPAIQGLTETPHLHPLELVQRGHGSDAIVVGGGPMGVRAADLLLRRGRRVIMLLNGPDCLPDFEPEIRIEVRRDLEARGATIHEHATVRQMRPAANRASVIFEEEGARREVDAETLVVATGLKPHTEGLDLDGIGLFRNADGAVAVDDRMQTSVSGIWAAGAVTGAPFSLSRYAQQAEIVAHNLTAPFFSREHFPLDPLPRLAPGQPPIGALGLSESEARRRHKDVRTAVVAAGGRGWIKAVGRERSGEILGVHVRSESAGDLLAYFGLAIRAGIPFPDLLERAIYPSPSGADLAHAAVKAWCGAAN